MKLYIGNIPFEAREDELRDLFTPFGTLGSATVIVDPRNDRSRGFGFVEFVDPMHGKAAIAGMNGQEVGGRKLVVNEARSRDGGSSGYRGNRGSYGGERERDGGRPRYLTRRPGTGRGRHAGHTTLDDPPRLGACPSSGASRAQEACEAQARRAEETDAGASSTTGNAVCASNTPVAGDLRRHGAICCVGAPCRGSNHDVTWAASPPPSVAQSYSRWRTPLRLQPPFSRLSLRNRRW